MSELSTRLEPDGMDTSATPPASIELNKVYPLSDTTPTPTSSSLLSHSSPSPSSHSPLLSCHGGGRPGVMDLPTETSYTTEENGKINIHVSVTINAGTLAELKKQRAQSRTGTLGGSGMSSLGAAPLSSQPSVHRFAGNTEEDQVIGDAKAGHCCRLM
uniref:Uncharacterized protein n=1 Tax=Cacopsylla melanoneura TaxID=428564 RepID=A0A8D8RE00_9HEMI